MSDVRVRFAPSPTGFFHIGSARTALFNWLYARHTGGKLVLRIEDTDRERNTPEALQVLLDGMRWLGLDWDEGPEVGGDFGPYFQSERNRIYIEYIEKLIIRDRLYEKDGAQWFRVSGEPVVIDDAIRGKVTRKEDKDFVVVRSDGNPVFHLVNVVDDLTMGITHVIRGEDHLSNTSKHCELFDALGAPRPVFAHIPLILKQEGKGKMSKRDTGALIEDYEKNGYLAEAVRNFLCLLGWSPKDDAEKMSIEDIIERFDFDGINKGNARFDEKKLNHINQLYLRDLPLETFAWMARPLLHEAGVLEEFADEDYVQDALRISQEKARDLASLPELVGFFFAEDSAVKPDEKAWSKLAKKGDPVARLRQIEALLTALSESDWTEAKLAEVFDAEAAKEDQKPFIFFQPVRLAVSGTAGGPEFYPMLQVLGRERVLARLGQL